VNGKNLIFGLMITFQINIYDMKHLISYKIFESIDSYNWKIVSNGDKCSKYEFIDEMNNKYLVEFKNIPHGKLLGNSYELVYYVYDENINKYSVSKVVNNVSPFRTVKTVLSDILRDFISKNSWVKKIVIHGLSKEIEKNEISQRTMLYLRHLRNNPIIGYRLQHHLNTINLIKI